jgi:hypothetical protein
MGARKTELVALIRNLEMAGGFFIEVAPNISGESFAVQLKALGEDYLMLSIVLTRNSAGADEMTQIAQRTNDLRSLDCTERLAQKCCKIAELLLEDMKNL